MHRPSSFVRAGRALVGLITLWCLGCSSYEPLLSALLGEKGTTMMVCNGDMTPPTASDASTASDRHHAARAVSVAVNDRGFDCGCGGSCHAPSPAFAAIAAPLSRVAGVDQQQPSEPLSVARTPLLPPPELTA